MIKYVKHNIDNNDTDYYKIDVTGDITIYKNDKIIGTLQTNCNEEFLNETRRKFPRLYRQWDESPHPLTF